MSDPIEIQTVSYSEVQTYRRCQKQHEYGYRQRLQRKWKNVRMFRGTILHDMLDAYVNHKIVNDYNGADPWDTLDTYAEKYAKYFEAERAEHGDIIGDCGKIFEGYLRKWRHDPLKYEQTELNLQLPLPNGRTLTAYIDKVALDQKGRRFLVDHKFMKSIPGADDRFSEIQLLIYYWMFTQLFPDIKLDGIIWDYGRAKAPREPEPLVKGGLTKRKDLDTDVHTYMTALGTHGLDPADYVDMLQILKGKENTFFERVILPKPPQAMIENVVADFMITTDQIINTKGASPRSMSPFNCNSCEFRPLCEGDVRGNDTNFILKSEYEPKGVR